MGEPRISVYIEEPIESKRHEVQLASDVDVDRLAANVASSLHLPKADNHGHPLKYQLIFNGQILQKGVRLRDTGVTSGAILSIIPATPSDELANSVEFEDEELARINPDLAIDEVISRLSSIKESIPSSKKLEMTRNLRLQRLERELARQNHQINNLAADLASQMWVKEVGLDATKLPMYRHIPVTIHVTDPIPSRKILNKLVSQTKAFWNSFDFSVIAEFPAEQGSWLKRLYFRARRLITGDEAHEYYSKAQRALEVRYLDKPQAEANSVQADAAAKLIQSLKDVDNASIQSGSLLLVKMTPQNGKSQIIVRTLTTEQIMCLARNQSILDTPEAAAEWLNVDLRKQEALEAKVMIPNFTIQESGTPLLLRGSTGSDPKK